MDEDPLRDEKIAQLQNATGIDSVEEAVFYLEVANWDIEKAVSNALASIPETSSPSYYSGIDLEAAKESLRKDFLRRTADRPFSERVLNFDVEYRDSTKHVSISDCKTIGGLKDILSSLFNVPRDQMKLYGWRSKVDDATVLSTLHLPVNNNLFMFSSESLPAAEKASFSGGPAASDHRRINIVNAETNETYECHFDADKTFSQLKQDVYGLTNIPPSRQVWKNMPVVATDDTKLRDINLDTPVHTVTIARSAPTCTLETTSSDDDDDYVLNNSSYQNFTDDSYIGDVSESPSADNAVAVPLIPSHFISVPDAVCNFIRVFESRYGKNHPIFYSGTLESALKEALEHKVKERKPLLIYVHSDKSISAHLFCTQVLCDPAMVDFINQNFVMWPWDVTTRENRESIEQQVGSVFGSLVSSEFSTISNDEYPIVITIAKYRGFYSVIQIIKHSCLLNDVMTQLLYGLDIFHQQNDNEEHEEKEREAREQVRIEQESAYQASLAADQAKAELKRIESEASIAKQREIEEEAERKEVERIWIEQRLPSEPSDECKEPTCTVRFRLPSGELIQRRFLTKDPLKILLAFIASKGFPANEYRFYTTFPKCDLTTVESDKSLDDLHMSPRETIVVEHR